MTVEKCGWVGMGFWGGRQRNNQGVDAVSCEGHFEHFEHHNGRKAGGMGGGGAPGILH